MKMIPIGIEDFRELRENNYYYIDKTSMIVDMLNNLSKVTLLTRPRRFGKTLNMSMLRYFFGIGSDPDLFKGLAVEKEKELCEMHQGKYPVISLSLKNVSGSDFEEAKEKLVENIVSETERHYYRMDEDSINRRDLDKLNRLMDYDMKQTVLTGSLRQLSDILHRYYHRPAIILIDEYDVPLDKANSCGYYDEMVRLIAGLFDALKTNPSMAFGILTGCLRVSKESIFTGLNNLRVRSITDFLFDSSFGFTEDEMSSLLHYYNLQNKLKVAKEWYDGYLFGRQRVYCPWSVLNYCDDVLHNSKAGPVSFWKNSSSNDIIKKFADKSDEETRKSLEKLISGGSIRRIINQELTYNELDKSIDNLWGVLFLTGYLTCKKAPQSREMELVIPNKEIHEIYTDQIEKWFDEVIKSSPDVSLLLSQSLIKGEAAKIEAVINNFLLRSVSIRDTMTKSLRENFYHGVLLGLLSNVDGWTVQSNTETGYGYSDLIFRSNNLTTAIIIELKYGFKNTGRALEQIDKMRYDTVLAGYDKVLKYGITFEGKTCKVIMT